MKFYACKYPVTYAYDSGTEESIILPTGTIFTIGGINGDAFDLKVVGKENINNVIVGINMLQFAFTETNNISSKE
jgi:hypothetical protein